MGRSGTPAEVGQLIFCQKFPRSVIILTSLRAWLLMLTIESSDVDAFHLKTSSRVSVSLFEFQALNFSVLSLFHVVSFFTNKEK